MDDAKDSDKTSDRDRVTRDINGKWIALSFYVVGAFEGQNVVPCLRPPLRNASHVQINEDQNGRQREETLCGPKAT